MIKIIIGNSPKTNSKIANNAINSKDNWLKLINLEVRVKNKKWLIKIIIIKNMFTVFLETKRRDWRIVYINQETQIMSSQLIKINNLNIKLKQNWRGKSYGHSDVICVFTQCEKHVCNFRN